MKTSSRKRVLAFWLVAVMLGGSAHDAFAAEMAVLQPANKVESNGTGMMSEMSQGVLGGEDAATRTVVTIDHVTIKENTVTVDGNGQKTAQAIAYASKDESTEIAQGELTWSIKGPDDAVKISHTTGEITVPAKAKAGMYTVTATPKTSTKDVAEGAKTAILTVKRAAPVATAVSKVFVDDVDVTGGVKGQITIPAGETRQLRATFLDQYSDAYTGQAEAVYTVEPKEGAPVSVSNTNLIVSADAAGTEVTITAKCKKSEGAQDRGKKFTVKVAAKQSETLKIEFVDFVNKVSYTGQKIEHPTVRMVGGQDLSNVTYKYEKVTPQNMLLSDVGMPHVKDVGTYRVTATYKSNGDVAYVSDTFEVTPKELTVTGLKATNRAYKKDDTIVKVTDGALQGILNQDDVSIASMEGTIADENVGDNKLVTVKVTLGGEKAGNYTVKAPTDVKVNITKAPYDGQKQVSVSVLKDKQHTFNLPEAIEKLDGVIASLATGAFNGSVVKSADVSDGVLTVTTRADAKDTENIVLTVQSKNYEDFELTYTLTATDKTDVSDKITFADKTVTHDGNKHKLDAANLDSSVKPEGSQNWTYTWTNVGTKAAKEEAAKMPEFTDVGVYEVTATYEDDKNLGQKTATLTIQEKPAVKSALRISANQLRSSQDENYNNFSLRTRDEADGYIRLRADANDYLDRQRINDKNSEWIGLEITPKNQEQAVNVEDLYVSMDGSSWSRLSGGTYRDFYLDGVSGNSFYLWYDTDDRDCADDIYLATDDKGANKFQIRVDFDAYSNSSSDSGSSGSGSSSTNKVDGQKVSTTTVDRTPSVSGNSASVSISSSTLSDALEKNKKEAKHENADKTFIELDVKTSKSVEDTTVTVPVKSLDKIAKEDTGLSVVTNQGTLQLDYHALSRIASAAGKSEVSIALEEDSKDQYTLMIKDGSSKIIDLGSGDAEISFAYKLKSGERASDVKVYRVGDGSKTWMSTYGGSTVYAGTDTYAAATGNYVTDMGAEYNESKKKVTFSTDALGTFLVTTDNLQTGGNSNNSNPSYTTFVDVPSYRWSAQYINKLASLGVINGTGGGYFEPTLYVTREEFVKMLAGVARANVSSYTTSYFPDVSPYRWSAPYIAWAVNHGVTAGTDGGMFAPEMKITREEMAAMIYRYTQSAGKTLPNKNVPVAFADSYNIDSWAVTAVSVMQQAGIIDGNVVNGRYTFDPKVPATREECAKMLCLLYEVI